MVAWHGFRAFIIDWLDSQLPKVIRKITNDQDRLLRVTKIGLITDKVEYDFDEWINQDNENVKS